MEGGWRAAEQSKRAIRTGHELEGMSHAAELSPSQQERLKCSRTRP